MSTETVKLIDAKLSFQMNHASIWEIIMAALDAMPFKTAFQSALSNNLIDEQPELWYREWFPIMDDPICYELKVILLATDKIIKC